MPIDWTLGHTVKLMRESWNYSQKELAEILAEPLGNKVSSVVAALSAIEAEKRKVPDSWIPLLRVVLEPRRHFEKAIGIGILTPKARTLPKPPEDGYATADDVVNDSIKESPKKKAKKPSRTLPPEEISGPPDNPWLAQMTGKPIHQDKESTASYMTVDGDDDEKLPEDCPEL